MTLRFFLWAVGAPLAIALLVGGCSTSSSGPSAACRGFCGNLCQSLAKCGLAASATCSDDCAAGLASNDCSTMRPADQLTCSELTELYDTATYCATLCQHAPSCGTFDSSLCTEGCVEEHPPIHNPASVAARTCDQLKPELRDYEDTGRALYSSGSASVHSVRTYGLCLHAGDCSDAQGCDVETSVCIPCKSDLQCARGYGTYACTQNGCESVSCLADTDCPSFSPRCDPTQHQCADCNEDADCAGNFFPRCDQPHHKCVLCLGDADCKGGAPRCDTSKNACVGCLTNADCSPDAPTCDASLHVCLTGSG